MINPLVLQSFIAELLGWTDLEPSGHIPPGWRLFGFDPADKKHKLVPNWPGDRNASYDLPVTNYQKYYEAFESIGLEVLKDPNYSETWEPSCHHSARRECLAWILYKGYRWVECADCKGKGIWDAQHDYPPSPIEKCRTCHGDGGEFVKV